MAFITETKSLSCLNPVKFQYQHAAALDLKEERQALKGKLIAYKYPLFNSYKDAVISKQSGLILCDKKDLGEVFKTDNKTAAIGDVAGTVVLGFGNTFIFRRGNRLFVGSTNTPQTITISPIGNKAELKLSNTEYIQIENEYPFTAYVSEERTNSENAPRRQFYVDCVDGKISLKIQTPSGYRFLSFNKIDKQVKAIGLELNETIVNPYMFDSTFITQLKTTHDCVLNNSEVKYHNDASFKEPKETSLSVKQTNKSNTSYLANYSIWQAALSATCSLNISNTKDNFSPSNIYNFS